MNITYFEPFALAWARAQRLLFRPFHIQTWLGLGFSAFLAELGRWSGSGGGRGGIKNRVSDHVFEEGAQRLHDFVHQPWVAAAFGAIVACAVLAAILLTWLSAHGRLVFLDGVMRERSDIIEPWGRTARIGDSLFALNLLILVAAAGVVVAMLAWPLADTFAGVWNEGVFRAPNLFAVLPALLMLAPIALVVAVFSALTHHFVVPVMLRHELTAFEAWGRFAPLLGANALHFTAALLLVMVARTAVGIALTVFGFLTCCVGFVIFGLPYVGDVLLLPVNVTFRAFGPEFLAQFGPEWDARVAHGSQEGEA